MAQLTTTTSSGQQGATQSPQTAGQAGNTGAQASSVQPGTAADLLNSQNGVPLHAQALTIVNVNPATTSIAQATPKTVAKRHINTPLMGVSIALLLIAIILFWMTSRSVKSTT